MENNTPYCYFFCNLASSPLFLKIILTTLGKILPVIIRYVRSLVFPIINQMVKVYFYKKKLAKITCSAFFGSKIENRDILVQLIELAILYRKIENMEGLYYFGRNERDFFVGQQYGLYVVDIYCSIGPLISVWLVLHNIVNLNKV